MTTETVNILVVLIAILAERYTFQNGRVFTPMQWAHLLTTAGFKNCEFYGSQELPLKKFTVSSKELIVVAGK